MAASNAGHTPPATATMTTSTRYELRAVARLSPLRPAVKITVSSGNPTRPMTSAASRRRTGSGESRLRRSWPPG